MSTDALPTESSSAHETGSAATGRRRVVAWVGSALRWFLARGPELLFVLLAGALLAAVTWDAFWLRSITYLGTADYWEHSAALRALLDNPWHPHNPHLVSPASSPRFNPEYLLIALFGRLVHADAIAAMGAASVLNTLLFEVGAFAFFRSYFGHRLAPLYGLLALFCAWWRGWPYSNVYQLQVYFSVSSYPSTHALAVTLLGWALAVRLLRARSVKPAGIALLSAWAAYVLVVHQLTAVMSLSGLVLLALGERNVPLASRAWVASCAVAGLALSFLWPYYSSWEVILGGKDESLHWVDQTVQAAVSGASSDPQFPAFFYRVPYILRALGLALLALPLIPFCLVTRKQLFPALGALSMGVPFVINRFVPLPLGHRFILLAIPYLQILLVWVLLALTPGTPQALSVLRFKPLRYGLPAALILTLGIFVQHNVELARRALEPGLRGAREWGSAVLGYAEQVAELAGRDAVVMATIGSSWPIPTYGPKVVALLHPNPLVADEAEREANVARFFNRRTNQAARDRILEAYGVTHLVLHRSDFYVLPRQLARHPLAQLRAGYYLFARH